MWCGNSNKCCPHFCFKFSSCDVIVRKSSRCLVSNVGFKLAHCTEGLVRNELNVVDLDIAFSIFCSCSSLNPWLSTLIRVQRRWYEERASRCPDIASCRLVPDSFCRFSSTSLNMRFTDIISPLAISLNIDVMNATEIRKKQFLLPALMVET